MKKQKFNENLPNVLSARSISEAAIIEEDECDEHMHIKLSEDMNYQSSASFH